MGIGLVAFPAPAHDAVDAATRLKKELDAVIDGPDYKHGTWGVLVVNAKTGQTVYERNPDALLSPASVTKLFSTAAALIAVGQDATTQTSIYRRGAVVDGVLRGDLILVAAGDLTFGGRTKDGKTVFKDKDHTYANSGLGESELTDTDPLAAIDDLARQVKAAGIKQVDGDVLIDDRLFARVQGTGSGPDAVTPIMVNDNVIDVLIEPGKKEGDPAKLTTRPKSDFYQVDAVVATASSKSLPMIQLTPISPTQFAVRGKIPAGGKPQVRIYPIDEPALFARAFLIEALRRQGVRANAALQRAPIAEFPPRNHYEKLEKVATFTSPPFKEAITVTLKVSHNLYASALPCLVAASKGMTTLDAGLREERSILNSLGVDVNQISFGGGAGGAPADHVTARATVQLLQGMARRPEWEAYRAALPLLGVDGTLAEAVSASSPARGKVSAKTGTLVWFDAANGRLLLKSKALAGAMTTKSGTELFLAMFVNNVPLPDGVGVTREGKVLGKLCEILYEAGP
jgi:D-alanyl-D-alanine carboxypeptidase/D-alanyl-D-alanine-endopeptidase (penicillin-binding protein 4)